MEAESRTQNSRLIWSNRVKVKFGRRIGEVKLCRAAAGAAQCLCCMQRLCI